MLNMILCNRINELVQPDSVRAQTELNRDQVKNPLVGPGLGVTVATRGLGSTEPPESSFCRLSLSRPLTRPNQPELHPIKEVSGCFRVVRLFNTEQQGKRLSGRSSSRRRTRKRRKGGIGLGLILQVSVQFPYSFPLFLS